MRLAPGHVIYSVKASANNLNNDVNFEHLIEHASSCTLARVDKNMSYMGSLKQTYITH